MRSRKRVFLPTFLCALLLFTAYVLLDTFVIERRLEAVTEPQTVSAQPGGETETTVSDTPVALRLAASQDKATAVIWGLTALNIFDTIYLYKTKWREKDGLRGSGSDEAG